MFRVQLDTRETTVWEPEGLEALGLRERQDLQQWFVEEFRDVGGSSGTHGLLESVVGSPEIGDGHVLAGSLLLITEEFAGWAHGGHRHADRLDLLLLDTAGSPVIVELKRGTADEFTDLQALRYAAYASTLTPDDVEDLLAKRLGVTVDEARAAIADHVDAASPATPLAEMGAVRIVLVAEAFTAPLTTTAMFLRQRDIDVRCVQLTVRRIDAESVAVSPRLLVPPPATEAFLVKRQQQERAEAVARASGRRRARTVNVLIDADEIEAGTELRFAVDTLGPKRRPPVAAWIAEDSDRGRAVWTGEAGGRALRWLADDQLYSVSELTRVIMTSALGTTQEAFPGPDYWLAPGSDTVVLSVLADRVLGRDA
ncbi:MAG: hypothetical protein M0P31_10945 [Solirubrobacteraceae bacterium]|nr:hypothetical protein [Solirubrobacteraceae bacterium]